MERHPLSKARVVFLDIDGVLHPHDAHFAVAEVASATADELRIAGLFVHCQLLADVLSAHPDVEVVIHSSWRKTHSLDALRRLLGPLGPFVSAVTSAELEREASIIDFIRRHRIPARRVVVLDDQPQLFAQLHPQVIACDPGVGLPSAIQALRDALRGPGVPIERLSFPSAEWMWSVDELVDAVIDLISESGELNLYTSSFRLDDLRRLAEKVRDS